MRINKAQYLSLLALGTILIASHEFGGNEGTHGVRATAHTAYAESTTARFLRVSAGGDATAAAGETIYKAKCVACHQASREGMPPTFPSLIGVEKRKTDDEIKAQIKAGKGMMPPFPDLTDDDLNSLLLFLKTPPPAKASVTGIANRLPSSRIS